MKRSWGRRWAMLGGMVVAMGVGRLLAEAQTGVPAPPSLEQARQPGHKLDPKADQARRMGVLMLADGVPAFLAQLRALNETEIALGELTVQKAASPAVKQYGEHMVRDHRQADQQLMDFARQRGLQILTRLEPTNEVQTRLMSATEANKSKLSVLDAPLYDQAYLASQVANHDEAIQLVTLARQQYPDLAPLLDGLLPKLREHRERAYQLLGQSQPQAQASQPQPQPAPQPAQPAQRQARPPAGERR
jgi:putative membrane protein